MDSKIPPSALFFSAALTRERPITVETSTSYFEAVELAYQSRDRCELRPENRAGTGQFSNFTAGARQKTANQSRAGCFTRATAQFKR